MKQQFLIFLTIFIFPFTLKAQKTNAPWDNTYAKGWPDHFNMVEIKSSLDGRIQKAVFYKTPLQKPQPLVVSLHTWSGDYLQEDPLAAEVVLRNWNYIHPDFMGPNNNPEACGSKEVISDIEDAIHFAIKNGNIDTSEIHIIGVSGGGYATLMAFMKLDYPVKSFSSWAGISNLEDWYWECKGRRLRYEHDLEGVTTGGNGFDAKEALKRSPALLQFPKNKRENATLHIYTGIHDGYTGSVPITQSINMFNHLVNEIEPSGQNQMVSDSLKLVLVEDRLNPAPDTNLILGNRIVHLYRKFQNIELTVFEGTHEMIVPQALSLLPVYNTKHTEKLNILTVGDSNGARKDGWPVQLRKLFPFSTIINHSIPGNTIGFDNLNNPKLNTLRNIQAYLDSTYAHLPDGSSLDFIVLDLGTNDAKKVFSDSIDKVSHNLDSLLRITKKYILTHNKTLPEILVVSPPPMNEKLANPVKYGGGNARIDKNNLRFKIVAQKNGARFIDVNSYFKNRKEENTVDGVHFTTSAQFELAGLIADAIKSYSCLK